MQLELGCPVRCADQDGGELGDVVIDPVARRVTHLVVQPRHRHSLARLVPIELAHAGGDGTISLDCSVEELRRFEAVDELAYLRFGEFPLADPDWDVGVSEVLALPYYACPGMEPYAGELDPQLTMTYDRVPKGEVEIRRSSRVRSSDGNTVGHVDGFLVDDHELITHLVLGHGHLWGRREVTIPIGAVESVATDEVSLSLSKDEVGELRPLPVDRWSIHESERR
jgi:sporulation protein YlmC with PRC-barrel domain